jgi:hypothetical protein
MPTWPRRCEGRRSSDLTVGREASCNGLLGMLGGMPMAVAAGHAGPTSRELADALEVMFQHPDVVALGVASTPAGSLDPDQYTRKAVLTLIRGARMAYR